MNAHALARSDHITFADEAQDSGPAIAPWKVLVADDEAEVHRVTRLALEGFRHFGRPVQLLHAHSGAEAVQRMREHPDTALVLMDVVMEHERAGLDAVLAIRHELRNALVRIVIRTGQPGQAPEALVVRHYDINDYKEKTELTAQKLHTVVHSGLSLYRELVTLHERQRGLEQLVGATTALQAQRSERQFARNALLQLTALLCPEDALADALLAHRPAGRPCTVLAGLGRHADAAGRTLDEAAPPELRAQAEAALGAPVTRHGARDFIASLVTGSGMLLLHVAGTRSATPVDATHVDLFCRNLAAGYENLRLLRELQDSRRTLILLLSTAIEQRSPTGGGHGQRVALFAQRLGELYGLAPATLEALPLAAALHDVGELAIPEAILNKRDALTGDEQALMETHTRWGQDLLWSQDSDILRMAGTIAGQHHERWDGSGYPAGLRGAQIDLLARITGLVDAFDELLHPRTGTRAQPLSSVLVRLGEERGRQFDPVLVDLLVANIDRFTDAARERL